MPAVIVTEKRNHRNATSIVEFLKTLVLAGLISIGIHTFLFQPFFIPSGSMVPTLLVGDYLFVNKFAYGFSHFSLPFSPDIFPGRIFSHMPARGAVIVLRPSGEPGTDFIKRVIGLPGDMVRVTQGQLYINDTLVPRTDEGDYTDDSSNMPVVARKFSEILPNGEVHAILKETDGPADTGSFDPNNTPVYRVPTGDLFVMGDNRDNSEDSRFMDGPVGFLPLENVVGPADMILFSIDVRSPIYAFWEWPSEIRWGRIFHRIS